ncbi:MAG: SUMF1/EgtB/PvdO family nonheme iron enzyme [Proteobacteria bacterium]|nr:SUMF1/EgtB/PvdO family nonheme iron enzyme [Pseudomonadota bacterium]
MAAVTPTSPFCNGITTSAASTSFTTGNIAGHTMVGIPGGLTVIGSTVKSRFADVQNPPEWVLLQPYFIGETTVSESQYSEIMGARGPQMERNGTKQYRLDLGDFPGNHPAILTKLSTQVEAYLKKIGAQLDLPNEDQWENAARGPAVNIQQLMEEETGKFTPADVVDFVAGRFENLVFKVLGEIFTDPRVRAFQKMMSEGIPFFGWRVFGTPSGRLSHEEAWFGQGYNGKTAPVNWGPKNAYGLFNMTGNVKELVRDGSGRSGLRGGSWSDEADYVMLRAGDRSNEYTPEDDIGFRVSATSKE